MPSVTWGGALSTPVIDVGHGQPIVFVHGVPDSGELWTPLIEKLRDGFRCIAPDLHGLGRSQVPRDFELSLENRAMWLRGLLDAVGVDAPVDLVCHDFGGPTALAWAVENPTRVRRLVIMATCFHREWEWHSLGRLYRTPIVGNIAAALQTAPVIGWTLFRREMQRGSKGLPVELIRATFDRLTREAVAHTLRLYRATPSECFVGWDERLYALVKQRPTLALWSDHDPYVPLAFAERLVSCGATLHRFTDVGHWMQLEAADRVGDLLRAFLEERAVA